MRRCRNHPGEPAIPLTPEVRPRHDLGVPLAAFVLVRIIINTGYRLFYPFLPAIARGLGIPFQTAALGLTLRSSVGVISPFLGSAADVRGHKAGMLAGLGLFIVGMLALGLWPTFPALLLALFLSGAARFLLDASVQATIGKTVPFAQRGRTIAISEMGWSLSFILGIPVVGWLIARGSWPAPFLWLAVLTGLGAAWLWRTVQPDETVRADRPSIWRNFGAVIRNQTALTILLVVLLTALANETIVIVYGAWLENAYALRVVAVGAVTMLFGAAELGGESLVAALTDRLGKRRAIVLGIGINLVACLLVSLAGASLAIAMTGLVLLFLSFEFMFVSVISLMSELEPGSRATLLSGNFSAHATGRLIGTLLGPWLFSAGIMANGIAAIAVNLIALLILAFGVRGKELYDPN